MEPIKIGDDQQPAVFVVEHHADDQPALEAALMKPERRLPAEELKIVFVLAGAYGGWVLAGSMNDHRADLPRPIPTTNHSVHP